MSGDIATELAQLEAEMRQPGSAYWREPERQERYRSLIEARAAGERNAPAVDSAAAEKRAIREMMRDHRSAYWRGPRAEELQARYHQLLGAEEPVVAGEDDAALPFDSEPPAWRDTFDDLVADLGYPEDMAIRDAADAAAWRGEIERAESNAGAIVGALAADGGDAGDRLIDAFDDGLTPGAKAAALSALAKFEPGWVPAATAGEMAAFRADASCGGRQLVTHWANEAPRRLGAAMHVFNEARDLMADPDRRAFDGWWRERTPRQRQIILWQLGGGR